MMGAADRELVMATALLLNLINAGEVKVQLHYKNSPPGTLTKQTLEGMGHAATALRIVHAITEDELNKFTEENLRKHERTN